MLTKNFLDNKMKKNNHINVEYFLALSKMDLVKVAYKLYRYFHDRAILSALFYQTVFDFDV